MHLNSVQLVALQWKELNKTMFTVFSVPTDITLSTPLSLKNTRDTFREKIKTKICWGSAAPPHTFSQYGVKPPPHTPPLGACGCGTIAPTALDCVYRTPYSFRPGAPSVPHDGLAQCPRRISPVLSTRVTQVILNTADRTALRVEDATVQ